MENPNILIVDDDLDLTNALKAILESEHYTVVTAADRIAGMEKISSDKPSLIILST